MFNTTMTPSTTESDASANSSCTNDTNTNTNIHDSPAFRILAMYKFFSPKFQQESLPALKESMECHCREHHVRGSLLVAPEGINGTLSYPLDACDTVSDDRVLSFFEALFPELMTRISSSPGHVFYRLKIKVKQEILTCRQEHPVCLDPTRQKGTYVQPGPEWNALLQDPDCLVIDARNDYEVRMGTFSNAHDPQTTTFSELLPWMQHTLETRKPKRVAMFCTGGIRCEKASAACLDLSRHLIPVHHLQGGILAYLEQVPAEESLWKGACYVFDQRVAVTHGLRPDPTITMCHACRAPLRQDEQQGHVDFVPGLHCVYCKHVASEKSRQRATARHHQIVLAQQKNWLHIHDPKEKVLRVLAGKHCDSIATPIKSATDHNKVSCGSNTAHQDDPASCA
jgi:UPF0176 protein